MPIADKGHPKGMGRKESFQTPPAGLAWRPLLCVGKRFTAGQPAELLHQRRGFGLGTQFHILDAYWKEANLLASKSMQ